MSSVFRMSSMQLERHGLSVSSFSGEWARFWQSRDDDYIDHTFLLNVQLGQESMFGLDVDAMTAKLHDDRGTGASEGVDAWMLEVVRSQMSTMKTRLA